MSAVFAPAGDRPRFHLRFRARDLRLLLAEPVATRFGQTEQLSLALTGVDFPVDLREGPAAFRHRRSQLERACFVVSYAQAAALARMRGVACSIEPVSEGALVTFTDELGSVGAVVRLVNAGDSAAFQLCEALTVRDTPLAPEERVYRVVRRLGFVVERSARKAVFEGVLFPLLAETLLAQGFRIPNVGDRNVLLAFQTAALRIEFGRVATPPEPARSSQEPNEPTGSNRGEVAARLRAALREETLQTAIATVHELATVLESRPLLAEAYSLVAEDTQRAGHPDCVPLLARAVEFEPTQRAVIHRLFTAAKRANALEVFRPFDDRLDSMPFAEAERSEVRAALE